MGSESRAASIWCSDRSAAAGSAPARSRTKIAFGPGAPFVGLRMSAGMSKSETKAPVPIDRCKPRPGPTAGIVAVPTIRRGVRLEIEP